MGLFFNFTNSLLSVFTTLGGSLLACLVICVFLLFPQVLKKKTEQFLNCLKDRLTVSLLLVLLLIGLVYVFTPNYFDHAEPTITSLGLALIRGDALYPFPELYPYNGLLYGPFLSRIQQFALSTGFPVVLMSKLSGVVLLFLSLLLCFRLLKSPISRGYLIYLVPFGLIVFWNRPEPLLLLLTCLTLVIADKFSKNVFVPIIVGIIAGAASAAKLHGAAYVIAAYLVVLFGTIPSVVSIILLCLSAVLSFLSFFLSGNTSVVSFFEYINIVSIHGISRSIFLGNFAYLIFLLFPVVFSLLNNQVSLSSRICVLGVVLIEMVVAVIGAKPGSGIYHFIPFVPVNAYLVQKINSKNNGFYVTLTKLTYFSLAITSLVFLIFTYLGIVNRWTEFNGAVSEIQTLKNEYPNLIMGVTDNKNYPFYYLRVHLTEPQVEYPPFMDLHFSGISDFEFLEKIKNCEISSFLLPRNGVPFTMKNLFSGEPLHSQSFQETFKSTYTQVYQGGFYSVYQCSVDR